MIDKWLCIDDNSRTINHKICVTIDNTLGRQMYGKLRNYFIDKIHIIHQQIVIGTSRTWQMKDIDI